MDPRRKSGGRRNTPIIGFERPIFNPIVESRPLSPIDAALMAAAKLGDVDSAYSYILHGADVNCHQDDGTTPLFAAAEVGHQKMVHFLLTQANIKPNIRGKSGRTPLYVAAAFGFLGATKMLLRHKANPNIGDVFGRPPLHNAVRSCYLPMTTLLVRHGADVNKPDGFGNTPLYIAMIEVCNPDQSRFLLRNGALPNMRSPRGNSVIFDCVLNLDPDIQNEVVHMLIRYGGQVNIRSPVSWSTPVHWCAFHRNLELMKFLLQMGANPNARTCGGITPLLIATREKYWAIMKHLKEAINQMKFQGYCVARQPSQGAVHTMGVTPVKNSSSVQLKTRQQVQFEHVMRARAQSVKESELTRGRSGSLGSSNSLGKLR